MRHGQADYAEKIDSQRNLTLHGISEVKVMGSWLKESMVTIDTIFVSPFKRAQQTAQLIAESFDNVMVMSTLDFITPSGNAKQVHDYLDSVTDDFDNLLIVSHMPLVSYLVAELTADNQSPIFQTAAIAQIDYDVKKMKGHLVRLIAPLDAAR